MAIYTNASVAVTSHQVTIDTDGIENSFSVKERKA